MPFVSDPEGDSSTANVTQLVTVQMNRVVETIVFDRRKFKVLVREVK